MVEVVEAKRGRVILDPKGFFTIRKEEKEIVAEHYKPVLKDGKRIGGKIDLVIRGNDAKSMCDTICNKKLINNLKYAAYLGYQLMKAEIAIKKNEDYHQ